MKSPLLAKKRPGQNIYQTLDGHTEDALIILSGYLREHRPLMEKLTGEWRMSFARLGQLLFLALFMHDLGKATREFQERLLQEKLSRELSHTFFGLPLVETDLPPEDERLVKVLVLSHHTQQFDRLYDSFELLPGVSYLGNQITDYLENYGRLHRKYFTDLFPLFARPLSPFAAASQGLGLRERIREEVSRLQVATRQSEPAPRLKALYSFAITLLKYCDSQSSRAFHQAALPEGTVCGTLLNHDRENPPRENTGPFPQLSGPCHLPQPPGNCTLAGTRNCSPKITVTTCPQNDGYGFNTGRELHTTDNPGKKDTCRYKVNDGNRFVFLLTPPGPRKVELALARAASLAEAGKREKLVWICPGQVASGFVRHRLACLLKSNKVAMVDATGYYPHDPNTRGIPLESNGRPNGMSGVNRERIFTCPFTVATLDHLIFSLVHGFPQADYALGNLIKAVVIIDGLPEPASPAFHYTLDALTLLREMNIPHITLDTLPAPGLKAYLAGAGYHLEDYFTERHKPLFLLKYGQEGPLEAVKDCYREGLKQVVYTPDPRAAVQMARRIKSALPGCRVVLWHYLFTREDRHARDAAIISLAEQTGPWVVVTGTAVDTSGLPRCHVVHTDNAPASLLTRRSYPLWPYGSTPGAYTNGQGPDIPVMIIHDHRKTTEPTVKLLQDSDPVQDARNPHGAMARQCRNTAFPEPGIITPGRMERHLEEEYRRNPPVPTNLGAVFRECTLFGYSPLEVRFADQPLVALWRPAERLMDVVPAGLWTENPGKQADLLPQLTVKVPVKWYSRYPDLFSTAGIPGETALICRLTYHEDDGLEPPPEKNVITLPDNRPR